MIKRTSIVLGLVLFSLAAGLYFYFQKLKLDRDIQVSLEHKAIYNAVGTLQKIWTEGDFPGIDGFLADCPSVTKLTGQERKCSVEMIQCLGRSAQFKRSHIDFKVTGPMVTRVNAGSRIGFSSGLELTLKSGKTNLLLYLENGCHEIYLPKRMYALEDTNLRKYSWWDNFNRSLFLDKYPVKIKDVVSWLKTDSDWKGGRELLQMLLAKEGNLPATILKKEEMERYCAFQGKQVMDTVLFDAASMHPGDLKKDRLEFPIRSIWPWDYKRKVGVVYDFREGKIKEVTTKQCDQLYSSECESLKNSEEKNGAHTWSGIRAVLGGEMEYLRNPIFPKKNLKMSSSYFKLNSPWHELGKRAYWDGLDFQFVNFNFRFFDPPTSITTFDVGFRCYREVR